MSKPFKVGFIGTGAIALKHMEHLARVPGVQIACASDISIKSAESARQLYKIPHIYTDYKQMLKEQQDVEAIDICTPNKLHAPCAIAAFEAGKHVMVEKPMAMNAVEAQAMVDAAKRAGKHLIIGFQFRFDPRTKVIRDQIDRGAFGKILYVRAQWLRRRGIPNWGVFGRKELSGGGPMIDLGVHVIETAHSLMGAPKPVSVTGNTWTFMGNRPSDIACQWPGWDSSTYDVEDFATAMVRFVTGTMLTVEVSFVAHIERDVWNLQIVGEKGGATWDPVQIFADQNGYMMNMTPAYIPPIDAWDYKMKHFIEVCRDGRLNEASGEHGLMIQKILDGVYASAALGREIPIE